MIDDTRREFRLNLDGSVNAKLTATVCGQAVTITARATGKAEIDADKIVRLKPSGHPGFDAVSVANELLDEKLRILKMMLGEAA